MAVFTIAKGGLVSLVIFRRKFFCYAERPRKQGRGSTVSLNCRLGPLNTVG